MLAVEPDDTDGLYNLALLLRKEPRGRQEAEALFRRVLVLKPNSVRTLIALGSTLSKDPERTCEAEQVSRRALEIEPESCIALAGVGVFLSARVGAGDLAEALQLCQQAVAGAASKKKSWRASTLAALGIVLVRSGELVAAREPLLRGARQRGGDSESR